MAAKVIDVVKRRCRCRLKVSWEKKYCSITCMRDDSVSFSLAMGQEKTNLATDEELQRKCREHV